jgi:fatty-acyl-CoA synthase
VLAALNHRLAPSELATIVAHCGARIILHDREFADTASSIAQAVPGLVAVDSDRYEVLVASSSPAHVPVRDERGLLSLNYTSGTTGEPKGVMYHHRGAYLQSLAVALQHHLEPSSVMLWTLPMFHCNGWCFTWATTAVGATHVCLPRIEAGEVWRLVDEETVTHLNAAPTVLIGLAAHPAADRERPLRLRVATGGAPPTPSLLARLEEIGMDVTHAYGLTETFGPAVLCDWHPEWDALPPAQRARLKARQGVSNTIGSALRVIADDGTDVPADGATTGEISLRGNNVMLGYYNDPAATRASAPDGWFRTGDLGVMHPDGYVEIRDRRKDMIITGGENVSSIELERLISSHPHVLEAAVVAAPDDLWGEVPVAFVTTRPGGPDLLAEDIIAFVRGRVAHFKAPRRVIFGELPKTSTGKVRKALLRSSLRDGEEQHGPVER